VDLYPTLMEIASAAAPENQPLDGESLVPLFRDSKAASKREAIFQHFPGYLGAGQNTWRTTPVGLIQAGPWKLMEYFEDHRLELYNLRDDVGETKNLASEQPEKTKELHAKMIAWRESVGAKMPTPNTPLAATQKKGKAKGKGKGKGKGKNQAE
jgi:arylsulfatase A-like enzyme